MVAMLIVDKANTEAKMKFLRSHRTISCGLGFKGPRLGLGILAIHTFSCCITGSLFLELLHVELGTPKENTFKPWFHVKIKLF